MLPWILTAAVLLAAVAVLIGATFYLFRFTLARPKASADSDDPLYEGDVAARNGLALMKALPHEELFETSFDGLKLHATFFPAAHSSNRTVLAVHGYKGSAWRAYSGFFEFYRALGFNLLLPDCRAHGQSEGTVIGFGNLDRRDCEVWAEYLAKRFGKTSKILLQGVSMGAATVLSAAGDPLPPEVKAVVADCGFTSAWEEFSYQIEQMFHLKPFPLLYFAEQLCKRRAGYDFRQNTPLQQVKKTALPILFVHGDADTFVPTQMVYTLYEACASEKELLVVKGARHAECMTVAPAQYQQAIRSFLEKIAF